MSTLSKTLTTGAALAACLLFAAPATVAQRDQASERTQEAEARHRRDVASFVVGGDLLAGA